VKSRAALLAASTRAALLAASTHAALLAASLLATSAAAQRVGPSELAPWLGPGAPPPPGPVAFYGTDLGWSFAHAGALQMLFGDTWFHARTLCEGGPSNDDVQITLPLAPPASPPAPRFAQSDGRAQPDRIFLYRDGASLPLGFGQVPIAAFGDGARAVGLFGRWAPARCTPSCGEDGFVCSPRLGACAPALLGITSVCELASGAGCQPTQRCEPAPTGFCVDPDSPQSDGTSASERFTVAHEHEFGVQRARRAASYDSIATWRTHRFLNATARTVARFSGRTGGSDYALGHGALLVWGRPGYSAEGARQAPLSLLVHDLPIETDAAGRWRFAPRYFAGLDPETREPRWSSRAAEAASLALDGAPGGSPVETYPIVNQLSVAWVPAPLERWVMLYGGDVTDLALEAPERARPGPEPGAVRIRFAEHPWGPWTPPAPLLAPGAPDRAGTPYGPGGVLFHPDCEDAPAAPCARSDPKRPLSGFLPGCVSLPFVHDPGRFYGANVIAEYTRPDGAGGVDLVWNVSTWNPYAVVFVRTKLWPD